MTTATRTSPEDRPTFRSASAGSPAVLVDRSAARPNIRVVVAWPVEPPLVAESVAMFESLGLRVARHTVETDGERFDLLANSADTELDAVALSDVLGALRRGLGDRDQLNRLVLSAGLTWREVVLVRAIARYARLAGLAISHPTAEAILLTHPAFVTGLVRLFKARFDPVSSDPTLEESLTAELGAQLDRITSLEDDRLLRALLEVVLATTRTSFYCVGDSGRPLERLTLKIETGRLGFVAPPHPLVETWVFAPSVEGLHLRAGRVARGGLRWSERPDDFRTEVLDLMKAQAVKNSVIVPAGAKGAFVLRGDTADLEPDALATAVQDGYSTFVRGLLDVTDNLVDGRVETPPGVRRRDGDDHYLVVAADKGTARFSDVANAIAARYRFWLGDAFASGGSVGYDHKGMGITARGAWVSVVRHLREHGIDPETDGMSVIGIGDMSGDVFGNGMLLSRRIRLVAAFDHRHVFLDPNPDPERSYAERERLFALRRSSWADYDATLISPGGGVFPRSAKRIPVSAEVRGALGLPDEVSALSPVEMVRAILRAPVDVLWNGGIGTYVKASTESHLDAADKANDAVRIDATQLRCVCVGEGGNLGLTQAARVEFELAGGRVNADFIDNSAGVDTSDHEVNLKILLDRAVAAGELPANARGQLLLDLTDDVAERVLTHNRRQTLAISLAASQAARNLDRHAGLIGYLENRGRLERHLAHLPDEASLLERRRDGRGLTRPEIAMVLALSKNTVRDDLLESTFTEIPEVADTVLGYFPPSLRRACSTANHPLAREIAATVLANDVVDRAGPGFFHRLEERTGASLVDVASAFTIARRVLDVDPLWRALEDDGLPPAAQLRALRRLQRLMEVACARLLRGRGGLDVSREIGRYVASVARLRAALPDWLTEDQRGDALTKVEELRAGGLPGPLATDVALVCVLEGAFDLVDAAARTGASVEEAAVRYAEIGSLLHLPVLRRCLRDEPADDHWTLAAKAGLDDDLAVLHRRLLEAVLSGVTLQGATATFDALVRSLDDAASGTDLAVVVVVLKEIARLIDGIAG